MKLYQDAATWFWKTEDAFTFPRKTRCPVVDWTSEYKDHLGRATFKISPFYKPSSVLDPSLRRPALDLVDRLFKSVTERHPIRFVGEMFKVSSRFPEGVCLVCRHPFRPRLDNLADGSVADLVGVI